MESQPNNSITEKSPEKELSQNQINKKSKIIIAISIGIAICAIIICIVVVVKTKKDDKDENEINTDSSRSTQSSSDYYISDEDRIAYIIGFGKFLENVELKNNVIAIFKEFMTEVAVITNEANKIYDKLNNPF